MQTVSNVVKLGFDKLYVCIYVYKYVVERGRDKKNLKKECVSDDTREGDDVIYHNPEIYIYIYTMMRWWIGTFGNLLGLEALSTTVDNGSLFNSN